MESANRMNGKGGSDLGGSERGLVLATNSGWGSVCRSGHGLCFETKCTKRTKVTADYANLVLFLISRV